VTAILSESHKQKPTSTLQTNLYILIYS